jgi:hypothetical protein
MFFFVTLQHMMQMNDISKPHDTIGNHVINATLKKTFKILPFQYTVNMERNKEQIYKQIQNI